MSMQPVAHLLVVVLVALPGCESQRPAQAALPAVELGTLAPVVGGTGRFNAPVPLAPAREAIADAGPRVAGRFEILEVSYDDHAWTCEWPGRWCRVRMTEGDPVEGWVVLGGR